MENYVLVAGLREMIFGLGIDILAGVPEIAM